MKTERVSFLFKLWRFHVCRNCFFRTSEIEGAKQLLKLHGVKKLIAMKQIYPGKKTAHFAKYLRNLLIGFWRRFKLFSGIPIVFFRTSSCFEPNNCRVSIQAANNGICLVHNRLHEHFKIPYSEMLFFDDEYRNIKDLSPLGESHVFTKTYCIKNPIQCVAPSQASCLVAAARSTRCWVRKAPRTGCALRIAPISTSPEQAITVPSNAACEPGVE